MKSQRSWAEILAFRHFFTSSFQYSVIVTSILLAKVLHLFSHVTSLPPLLFLLYLPTYLALDVVAAAATWNLVHLKCHGLLSVFLSLVRRVICLGIIGAASCQISFYLEMGSDIKWGAAKNFAHDRAGMKLFMSGSKHAAVIAAVITITARAISHPLYAVTNILASTVVKVIIPRRLRQRLCGGLEYKVIPGEDEAPVSQEDRSLDGGSLNAEPKAGLENEISGGPSWLTRIMVLAPIITTAILLVVRPPNPPFGHMSGTLPFTLLEIWSPSAQAICRAGHLPDEIIFPLPQLVSSTHWEPTKDNFPGWMPKAKTSTSDLKGWDRTLAQSWLPVGRINGFDRWYDNLSSVEGVNYDPVRDPVRITNLDQDLLAPLAELRKHNATIKHIVMISLESTRKDVFPFKKDSNIHNLVKRSHKTSESAAEADVHLATLTPNAEILTGEERRFDFNKRPISESRTWRDTSKEMGGINVAGAFTTSTTTFKSMIGSHCGVQPLPVDFTVEAHGHIYQPCVPSILELFNSNKANTSTPSEFTSMPWKSVFVQSITDHYDHQDELNKHIGFSKVIVKDDLLDPSSKYYPPTEEESNYFGFPESQVKPYLRDLFHEAEEKNERLFLSHFTSSTHHPWNVPKGGGEDIEYLARNRLKKNHQLNSYLNTVRYGDKWIGEVMDLLEESGIIDQTLVVLVGDHGMAFREDSKVYSTFENGHITNMEVPLVFFHPKLPRTQLDVRTTSLSIIPTILDLLISTDSLNSQDLDIASNLVHQYEGQSLIRPYQTTKNGRQAWVISVLNAGAALLSISTSAFPFRLIIPVCKSGLYRFTSTDVDPHELTPTEANSILDLTALVAKLSPEAAAWVVDAEKVGKWWVLEQRRRWRYHGAARQEDMTAKQMQGAGTEPKKHWWNT
ncbi:uncharacterized protein BP5553_05554 [Venustampulla echinocandica]|uniref:Sulfatase N-terminal domain-containing protein n=1 Tax=Venustampulla echinocandica TaxID=2656787 RepID=A0A370TRH0_9HELO|nr:uncharacterized protein BP5553_05554 [Venustampulla echinocandica]RDL38121.1 hypothetical protein BP5553_05554 [Venustampulla echinocandica]